MSMRPVGHGPVAAPTSPRRRSLTVFAVVLASVLVVLGSVLAVHRLTASSSSCSPPSEPEMQVQEAFLRSHVSDASGLEWTVLDCDDHGDAYLAFTTALTSVAAREGFLTDASCSPYRRAGRWY